MWCSRKRVGLAVCRGQNHFFLRYLTIWMTVGKSPSLSESQFSHLYQVTIITVDILIELPQIRYCPRKCFANPGILDNSQLSHMNQWNKIHIFEGSRQIIWYDYMRQTDLTTEMNLHCSSTKYFVNRWCSPKLFPIVMENALFIAEP